MKVRALVACAAASIAAGATAAPAATAPDSPAAVAAPAATAPDSAAAVAVRSAARAAASAPRRAGAASSLAPAAAVARRCARLRPSGLRLRRKRGKTTARLRWRRPARRRKATYRVLRNRRVVGQTRRRSMRVRVSLGRRYRFTVVALRRNGRPTRCRASERIRVAYRPPGRPRYLTVRGDERRLRLTWKRARRGDAALAGYRLLRDGRTVGQRATTSWSLPAAPNRRYRFRVVAVDRRGRESAPSNPVTAVTGHEPPTTPGGLHAPAVTDTSIDLAWRPSTVKAGRVVGYRVLRDGAVVGQAAAASRRLGNLAPSTDYRLAVVAIDNYGYASAPATLGARTLDPVPTSGHVHAYLLASTDQSFADLRAHYRQVGTVYPTYFDCTGDAELVGADDPLVTRWAQARKIKVLPRVNCQRTAVVSRILSDPATRASWLDQLVRLARVVGYDGISLDFEAGPPEDRDAMTAFVEELSRRLHADGRLLTVAVSAKLRDIPTHPRSGIFDYPRLAEAADYLFVMAWGLHWSTSPPGPQDDLAWVRQVVDYVASLPQRRKFVYGTNLYALDWPAGGGPANVATAYQYQDIVPLLPAFGAIVRLDPVSDNHHATYTDAAGVAHDVWFPDAATTGRRLTLARDAGLGGVGLWRLGREDQRVWQHPLLAPGSFAAP